MPLNSSTGKLLFNLIPAEDTAVSPLFQMWELCHLFRVEWLKTCSRNLNTGLCDAKWSVHHLPAFMCAKSLQLCLTLGSSVDCSPPGSSVHGDSPGKSTGVGCHPLLQGIFLTQGSNPGLLCLLHRQMGSLPLGTPTHLVLLWYVIYISVFCLILLTLCIFLKWAY